MKPNRFFPLSLLALTSLPHAPARAEIIFFSWWDPHFETPGVFSDVRGGFTRDARLPDEDPIQVVNSDSSTKTNTDVASVRVFPPGSSVVDPDAFTARAQSDFWQNHAETRTIVTGFGESENKEYFDSRTHVMQAESIWSDHWTFSGVGVGSATVSVSANFDVNITSSPCSPGLCEQVDNPIFTRQELKDWWYRIYGSIRVFDLDVIDQLYQVDSDEFIEVPHEVAAFQVFQQGANQTQDFFSPIEPFIGPMPNARLTPIRSSGTASFVPVAGHRYAVAGHIHIQSRNGADVDAAHTLSLDHVLLGPGLRLNSVAINNGAQLKVFDATRLAITQTGGDEVTLAFPSVPGFTYFVEFKNSLDVSDWTQLATRVGDGGVQAVTDSISGRPARFYRLRIQ